VASTASIGATLTTGSAAVADPLAAIAVPSLTGSAVAINLTAGSQTINPGIYSGIKVSGTGTSLKLSPGVYVLSGGGLSVTGSASLSGTGVMIYNAGSTYPAAGGTYGGIALSTTGTVNLSAPTTGAYAGILFFQARTNPTLISITESATMTLSGVIYASDALLSVSGTSGGVINGAMVVNRIQMSGSAGASAPAILSIASASLAIPGRTGPLASEPAEITPLVATARVGTSPESVLEELVANLLSSSLGALAQSGAAKDHPSNIMTVARAERGVSRPGGAYLASVPAGPMARLERLGDRLTAGELRGRDSLV
jgi:hypothetical protein